MNGKMITLILGLFLIVLYMSVFGASYDKATRIGQYVSIAVIILCIVDEIFRQGD